MCKKTLNIGLVGFGAMGKAHAFSVSAIPFFYPGAGFQAKVVSLATTDYSRCLKICHEYNIPDAAQSVDALLEDKDINIIDICSPNTTHYGLIMKAIAAGKHILCEKPLCTDYEKATEAALSAEKSGLICGVVFNNRRLAPVIRAKQIIEEGRLGKILSFRFDYLHDSCTDPSRPAGWKQTAAAGGGTLVDLGSHIIDLCRYLCGEFSAVSAVTQIAYPTHPDMYGNTYETDADEATYITAKLGCGAVGTLTASKICVGTNDGLSFDIFGTLGALHFSLMEPDWLYYYDATKSPKPVGGYAGYTKIECVGRYPSPGGKFPSPKAPVGWLRGHIGNMYDFLSAIADNRSFTPSFYDGAQVQRVIDCALMSVKSGKMINL